MSKVRKSRPIGSTGVIKKPVSSVSAAVVAPIKKIETGM